MNWAEFVSNGTLHFQRWNTSRPRERAGWRWMQSQKVFDDVDVIVAPTSGEQLVITNLTGHPAVILPNGLRGSDAPKYPSDDAERFSRMRGGPGTPTSLTFLGKLYGEAETAGVRARAYQDANGDFISSIQS